MVMDNLKESHRVFKTPSNVTNGLYNLYPTLSVLVASPVTFVSAAANEGVTCFLSLPKYSHTVQNTGLYLLESHTACNTKPFVFLQYILFENDSSFE